MRGDDMEHTPGPKWYITELNDGIQWLTDGDFGMYPAAAPELLEALEGLRLWVLGDCDINKMNSIMDQARAAIKAAKGDA
jgi:hypothetical protein